MIFAFMTITVYVGQAETLDDNKISKSSSKTFYAAPKSGKWVPEYGGASTPFRCVCVESVTTSECLVGDTTSNISLCE